MPAQMIWTKDLAKGQAHKVSMAPGVSVVNQPLNEAAIY
jgi:hypothetical protein